MIRLAFFFSALSLAAVMDIRTRTIPDWLVVLVALTSMLPPGQPNLLGVLAGLPLLLAGITIGGIGGGDVKLMGHAAWFLERAKRLRDCFLHCACWCCGMRQGIWAEKRTERNKKRRRNRHTRLFRFFLQEC